MTFDEIKAAVDAGQTVHWANTGYVVHKDRLSQYLITYVSNGSCIGLTDRSGQRLNGKEAEFFIARPEGGSENSRRQSRPDGQGRGVAPGGAGAFHSEGSSNSWAGLKGKRAFWFVIPQGVEKAIPDALARTSGTGQSKRNHPMFAGTLTRNVETAAAQYTGMIHSTRFDIAIQLEARAKMSERSPDFDVTAVNKSGRKVRIGTAWNETGNTSGNPYISMQIDVGLGPFRVRQNRNQEIFLCHKGGKHGAEMIAARWARARGVAQARFDPRWSAHGRAAPFKCNDEMLDDKFAATGVVLFGGNGVALNLGQKAEAKGLTVMRVADPAKKASQD